LQVKLKPTNNERAGRSCPFLYEGTNEMKSTIVIDHDNFDSDAKRMIVLTTLEATLILQAIEALETQAAAAKALLRSLGFDHYTHATDNPRTIARMKLKVKEASDDSN
jgi:hypothetical protein